MNAYVSLMLRAAIVLAPVALLLSWHFDARSIAIAERIASLEAECGPTADGSWRLLQELRVSAAESARTSRLWSVLFNIACGAIGGTTLAVAGARRHRIAEALGLPAGIEGARYRWRRWRLLGVRYPGPLAAHTFGVSLMLGAFSLLVAFISAHDVSGGIVGSVLRSLALVLFLCHAVASWWAARLAGRVRLTLLSVVGGAIAVIVAGIDLLVSLGLLVVGLASL